MQPPQGPGRITRTVHFTSNVHFGPLEALAPGIPFQANEPDPKAIAFTDPDGETHVFPLSDEGRRAVIQMMTGGVVLG